MNTHVRYICRAHLNKLESDNFPDIQSRETP
jgi:hypothetical protein